MKKVFLTVFLCSVLSAISAQTKRFEVGIKAGAGTSWFLPSDDWEFNLSYNFSAQFKWNINPNIALVVNPGYERKGNLYYGNIRDEDGYPLGSFRFNDQLNYFVVPVLFRASFGRKTQFFLQVGSSYNFILSSYLKSEYQNFYIENTESINPIEIAVLFGIGTEIPLSRDFRMEFELRTNYGFSEIADFGTYFDSNNFNILLLVGLQYVFGENLR